MKKIILGKIGTSLFETHIILQFNDVKIKSTGDESYTLPDGKMPDDINKWQSRPDPVIEEGWVLLESERPTDNDYIVSENGDWVIDKSIAINSFNKQKLELMNYADKQIELLHDSIEFDIADDDTKDKLLSWRKYRVLLNHVDINSVSNIGWPAIPDVI
jgi:hypothetical protein